MYRALRRHYNVKKAIRKRNIARQIYSNHESDYEYYDNLHQYSDNKIHCSCPLCAFNAKKNGRVLFGRILPRGDKLREQKLIAREELYNKGELSTGDPITDSYYNKVS